MEARKKKGIQIIPLIIIIGLALFSIWLKTTVSGDSKAEERKVVYDKKVGDLSVELKEPILSTDEDTGKVIVRIPADVKNSSDHAYTLHVKHFVLNDTDLVSTIFNVKATLISGKIKRGEEKSGEIIATLETRDKAEVKSVKPILSIYDMKSEKTTELNPVLSLQ